MAELIVGLYEFYFYKDLTVFTSKLDDVLGKIHKDLFQTALVTLDIEIDIVEGAHLLIFKILLSRSHFVWKSFVIN